MKDRVAQIFREQIADWDRAIPLMESGMITMRHGNIDVTADHLKLIRERREHLSELLATLDAGGADLTADR